MSNMKVGATSTNFTAVKIAFENNYACMNVTCAQVGGLWYDADSTYYTDAAPCDWTAPTTTAAANTGAGTAQTLTGSFTMLVNDQASFVDNSNAQTAVRNAIANQTNITVSRIAVQFVSLRRLRTSASEEEDSLRRLTSGSVRADYTITLPASMSAADQTTAVSNINAMTQNGFATAVTQQISSLGLSYTVLVTAITTSTDGTASSAPATAAVAFVVWAAVAVAW
jgi:hypothetical protein